jgi:hypothetical protein
MILKITQFIYWLFFFTNGWLQSTLTNNNLHIPLSYPFLLVDGWWLSYCCRCFLSLWKSQNISKQAQKRRVLMTSKTPIHLASRTEFCGTPGEGPLKAHETGAVSKNPRPMGSLFVKHNHWELRLSKIKCGHSGETILGLLHPEDGGSAFYRNVGKYLQVDDSAYHRWRLPSLQ